MLGFEYEEIVLSYDDRYVGLYVLKTGLHGYYYRGDGVEEGHKAKSMSASEEERDISGHGVSLLHDHVSISRE